MDRDDFVIAVFLVVCEQSRAIQRHYRGRRGGFAPALTDEEVITMQTWGTILFRLLSSLSTPKIQQLMLYTCICFCFCIEIVQEKRQVKIRTGQCFHH